MQMLLGIGAENTQFIELAIGGGWCLGFYITEDESNTEREAQGRISKASAIASPNVCFLRVRDNELPVWL